MGLLSFLGIRKKRDRMCLKAIELVNEHLFGGKLDKIPKKLISRLAKIEDETNNPTFDDLKKMIEDSAKLREEPIEHIILEVYSGLVMNKIICEWVIEKETKPQIHTDRN